MPRWSSADMAGLAALLVLGAVWLACSEPVAYRLWPPALSARSNGAGGKPVVKPEVLMATVAGDARLRTAVCAAAAAAVGAAFGGPATTIAALFVGVGVAAYVGRLEPAARRRERRQLSSDLPLVTDLLGACLAVGRPVDESVRVVAASVGGPIGVRLGELAARLELGGDPLVEWARLEAQPGLGSLGRTMVRAIRSGAPPVAGLDRLGRDCRREQRYETEQRARTVGVRAAGPLAACFLPAFMLIGVVPAVAGMFAELGF